jgi:hypothetical protein
MRDRLFHREAASNRGNFECDGMQAAPGEAAGNRSRKPKES